MKLTTAAAILSLVVSVPSFSLSFTSLSSLEPFSQIDNKFQNQQQRQPKRNPLSQSLSICTLRSSSSSLSSTTLSSSSTIEPTTTEPLQPPQEQPKRLESRQDVLKLTFRELQKECKARDLPASGSTAVLRNRLTENVVGGMSHNSNTALESALVNSSSQEEEEEEEGGDANDASGGPSSTALSREFQSLCNEIHQRAGAGHWKTATRRLKALKKKLSHDTSDDPSAPTVIPEDVYLAVLKSCLADRSSGARASVPSRKILEEMVDAGYVIPADLGRDAVINCLGTGPGGTHDECGGIDVALAMIAAMERGRDVSEDGVLSQHSDTYEAVVKALGRDGDVEESVEMLGMVVIDKGMTPLLGTFASVAESVSRSGKGENGLGGMKKGELVLQVLQYAKVAGYELDDIGAAEAGRTLLACGVIAAEEMDNLALGLRLLTAAKKAKDLGSTDEPDALVCASSSAAQRAATLLHKRAIDRAIAESNWKLATQILELMPRRSLTPSPGLLKKVIAICAKSEKSRKATSLLLDWVKRYETKQTADMPPLSVFNTVMNACEICGEEELTLSVLDTMKRTHDTDGNTITFNIALKRLAKSANQVGCEGIIIGMLQAGIEPTVVSYTTALGACAQEKNFGMAQTWLDRMRSRCVDPNVYTYNTALASCLDGSLEGSKAGSAIALQMMEDTKKELLSERKGGTNSACPNAYTKTLSRSLMKQLRENWRSGAIDMDEAKATVRVPLLRLIDFEKTEEAKKLMSDRTELEASDDECVIEQMQQDVEYLDVEKLHKDSHRTAEI